jgi:hypothetical protein
MFDVQQQIENEMLSNAKDVANLPVGRVGLYSASVQGDMYNQGLMSLAGLMGGSPDPRIGKEQALQSIFEEYGNPETPKEAVAIADALLAKGFNAEAQQFMDFSVELRNSMPKPAEKTDKIKNYEYGQNLPEDMQQAYFDTINPSQVPNSYAEYLRTDDTPTGKEYLTYLGTGNLAATKEWQNYVNTTNAPTKEGFAIWIDRNQAKQKFGSAKEARITTLMNDPEFLIKPEKEQTRLLNAIESEYEQIETFTQAGVVYNADTKEAMLPGSKETIPTVTVGGKVLDARTMTVLNSDGVRREMVKRDDKQWYYVDNGSKVFSSNVTVKDPETKAAAIYTQLGMPKNESEKIALASKLIQDGLAGTQIFADLMASVDKDSANAIQRENLVVKSIERLGDNYVKSGVGTMNTILQPVEQLISQYMTSSTAQDGTTVWSGSIPGWSTVKRGQRLQPGKTGYQARYFAQTASTLINTVLKQRSGQAVTDPEWKRLQDEYSSGWQTSAGFASWVGRIRDFTNKTQQNVVGGYQPIVVNRYFANQGQYVTLTNPDDLAQRNQIPINGFYKDSEGNIRKRTQ